MRFQGALIKEQGVTFAVVIVRKHLLNDSTGATDAIRDFQPVFPGVPIVLMAQDSRGTPTYFGRRDLAKFMAKVPLSSVPWKEYSFS